MSSEEELAEEAEETTQIHSLPVELLERLFGYISAAELMQSTQLVCQCWRRILASPKYWRGRLRRRQKSLRLSELYESAPTFSIQRTVGAVEREESRWSGASGPPHKLIPNYSTIDALRLIQGGEFLLSGGRDRSIVLWDLQSGDKVSEKSNAHSGWIWSIHCGDEGSFYSAGFDAHIRGWSLGEGRALSKVEDAKTRAAVLCLAAGPDQSLLASSYDKAVAVLDRRAALAQVQRLQHHRGPVNALVSQTSPNGEAGNVFFSCSEDRTLRLYDARMWAPLGEPARFRSAPLAMALAQGQLWLTDSNGRLHYFDGSGREGLSSTPLRSFLVVDKTPPTPANPSPQRYAKVRNVVANRGSVIVATGERRVRVFRTGAQVKSWADFSSLPAEPSRIDYCPRSGNLVAALPDESIALWGPKLQQVSAKA